MNYSVQPFCFLRNIRIPMLAVLVLAAAVWASIQLGSGEKPLKGDSALPPQVAALNSQLGQLPLLFVENRGQWNPGAKFMARKDNFIAWFEDDAIILQQEQSEGENDFIGVVVRMDFEGASESVRLEGENRQSAAFNYLKGKSRSGWRSKVAAYQQVLYRGLYKDIDMRLREGAGKLEYDMLLAAGADPGQVIIRCQGIEGLEIDEDGALLMKTTFGAIRQKPPLTWYEMPDGSRQPVACNFRIIDNQRYSFFVGDSQPDLAMVIDPGLEWSTYLGSPAFDWQGFPNGFAVTGNGEVLVTGRTQSAQFPTTVGAYNTSFSGDFDIFVSCFDPKQSGAAQLIWSTFIGGSGFDDAYTLKVEASGNIILAGPTTSTDFPVTRNAYDATPNGGRDGHVTRLDPSGSTILYCTLIGGASDDFITDIAFDSPDNFVLTGYTYSGDFPTTPGAYDISLNGNADIFVAQLDISQANLVWSTFLGGSLFDWALHLTVDSSGMVIIAGDVESNDFPTTPGAFSETYNGGPRDAFFTRFDPTQSGPAQLSYSTFFGGSADENANALDVDSDGVITLAGWTSSTDLPFPATFSAYDSSHNGSFDAYVSRFDLNQTGNAQLLYSTFIGGSSDEGVNAMALDASGRIIIGGFVASMDFPVTLNAFDATYNGGGGDAYILRLDPHRVGNSQLQYSTFIGGATGTDVLLSMALDSPDTVFSALTTLSSDFPTTIGAYDQIANGNWDVALTKVVLDSVTTISRIPPRNLQATPGSNQIDLLWEAPFPPGELGYDDGTAEFGGSFINGATGQTAVRFTPNVYPATLLGIKILFFDNGGGEDDDIEYSVWVNPTGGHAPPTAQILSNTPYTVQNRGAFEEIDISANGIVINSGDFFYSATQLDTVGFAQGIDQDEPFGSRSWIRFDGDPNWLFLPDIGFSFDLIIRALVMEGSGANAKITELAPINLPEQNISFSAKKPLPVRAKVSADNFKKTGSYGKTLFSASPAKTLLKNQQLFSPEITGNKNRGASVIAGLLGYNLYRSENMVIFSIIASTDSLTFTFTDNNVVENITYWYYVTAVYDQGESAPSRIVSAALGESELLLSLNHTPGDLTMSILNEGSIGIDPSFTAGAGVTWKGTPGLFYGGLIFGTASAASVNGHPLFDVHDMANIGSNFGGGFTSDADFDQISEAALNDQRATNPFNIDVIQRSYSNTGDDFVFIRYGYVNTNAATISGFYAGINCDWDIANFNANLGGYALNENLVYQFDSNAGGPYFGITALDGESGVSANTTIPTNPGSDAFTHITTLPPLPLDPVGDFRSWIGTGPLDIAPGDTAWTTFAIVAGDDLAQIRTNASNASQKAFALGWIDEALGIDDEEPGLPIEFALEQNYPNPFNPGTTIEFTLPEAAGVKLTIYNTLGQEVAVLINSRLNAGQHRFTWQAADLPSGVYFYRLSSSPLKMGKGKVQTRKMLLVK